MMDACAITSFFSERPGYAVQACRRNNYIARERILQTFS